MLKFGKYGKKTAAHNIWRCRHTKCIKTNDPMLQDPRNAYHFRNKIRQLKKCHLKNSVWTKRSTPFVESANCGNICQINQVNTVWNTWPLSTVKPDTRLIHLFTLEKTSQETEEMWMSEKMVFSNFVGPTSDLEGEWQSIILLRQFLSPIVCGRKEWLLQELFYKTKVKFLPVVSQRIVTCAAQNFCLLVLWRCAHKFAKQRRWSSCFLPSTIPQRLVPMKRRLRK